MSHPEKDAREVALWLLYAADVGRRAAELVLSQSVKTVESLKPNIERHWDSVEERVVGVLSNLEDVDADVQQVSPRWKVDRMAFIDRNILRVGTWELLNMRTRPIIVINACVELGKTYGEDSTPGFINGLLDEFCSEHGITVE